MSAYYRPDSSSLIGRAARALEPKLEQPIPDELALPWLNTELARAWLLEDAGLSVRAVEQQGSTLTFVTSLRPGEARVTGGTVTVTGALDNSGSTLVLSASTGSLTLGRSKNRI